MCATTASSPTTAARSAGSSAASATAKASRGGSCTTSTPSTFEPVGGRLNILRPGGKTCPRPRVHGHPLRAAALRRAPPRVREDARPRGTSGVRTRRPPQASTLNGPSGARSCAGTGEVSTCVSGSCATTCNTLTPVNRATVWGRSDRIHFEDWPGRVRDDDLVVAHRVPHLRQRLQRHGVTDHAVALGHARVAPLHQRPFEPFLGHRSLGGSGTTGRHDERRDDRPTLATMDQRFDQLRRCSGAVGEHDHVSGHRAAPFIGCESFANATARTALRR